MSNFKLIKQHPVNPDQPMPQQFSHNSNPWNSNGNQQQANLAAQNDVINTQQAKLREQIIQSEKNLQAQHQVLTTFTLKRIHEKLNDAA